jgi:MtN3 and saliva related transmembrane protein
MANFIDIIGMIAASFTTFSFLPQAIKTLKTKETKGISLIMYAIFTCGVFFWLIYGILLQNSIIIFANTITLILSSIILVIKIKNIYLKKEKI